MFFEGLEKIDTQLDQLVKINKFFYKFLLFKLEKADLKDIKLNSIPQKKWESYYHEKKNKHLEEILSNNYDFFDLPGFMPNTSFNEEKKMKKRK